MNMRDYCLLSIRPKRPNNSLTLSWEKLIIPLPLSLKCQVMRIARENNLSQAALGLVIVRAVVENETWLTAALRSAGGQSILGGERKTIMDDHAKRPSWATGKKLCRFHLDHDLYFEVQRVAGSRRLSMTQFIAQVLREAVTLEDVNGAGLKAA